MPEDAPSRTTVPPLEPLTDAEAIGRLIGREARWVREQALGGHLPAYKVGGVWRFRPSEVLAALGLEGRS